MRVSLAKIVLSFCAVAFIHTTALHAQSDEDSGQVPTHSRKVFGYQDPKTGEFHSLRHSWTPLPDAATTAPLTGMLEVQVTITLKTAIPSGGAIFCESDFVFSSENISTASAATYEESAGVKATVAGSTATCTLKIPYSLAIAPASSTVINSLAGDLLVDMGTVSTSSSTIFTGLTRGFSQPIPTAKTLPANGATTLYTISVTL